MTTQDLVNYFAVLQDKFGSPNLISSEVVGFLNHATNEWLNRLVPDSQGGVVNFEEDSNVTAQLKPLIYTVSLNTTSEGILTQSALDAALTTAVGTASSTFRIMAVSSSAAPVRYIKHNNLATNTRNLYKTPTSSYRLYTQVAAGYQFYPQAVTPLGVTVIKKPAVLSLTGPVNPELEDYVLYNILTIALQLAGVSTRDEELIGAVRNITVQGK